MLILILILILNEHSSRVYNGIHLYNCVDVSGGFSSSMIDAIRHALQASRALHIKKEGKKYEQLTLNEALYMATIGGAKGSHLFNSMKY